MSILIKGMEMPKNCMECSFSDHEAWCLIPGSWKERYYCPKDKISEHCPLVQIPPHGDLIDRDEQIERAWRLNLSTRELIETMLKSAPTIIPSEE